MKIILSLAFLFLTFLSVNAQIKDKEVRATVQTFIDCFKNGDTATLKTLVVYPIQMNYPNPDIKNEGDFVARYDELFDDSLINAIAKSKAKKHWSKVGERGIMLSHGGVWLTTDGKLKAINHTTKTAKEKQAALIAADREQLHESLKEFQTPILYLETEKFQVRIDLMEDGNYRYASWSKGTSQSEKPDLIVKYGDINYDGSGGNHNYEFINGNYTYIVWVWVLGVDETPGTLKVYKNAKEILDQKAILLNN